MLKLDSISKSFGDKHVLHDISMEIGKGERFTLLGQSGCGKSTLLRLIAGFESPDKGKIWVEGDEIGSLPIEKRPVGMIFQNYALFPHMTIYDNIALGPRVRKLAEPEIEKRIDELLEITHLRGLKNSYPQNISGGEAQRVALARAVINRPKILLLDEPLSALDPSLRKHLREELVEMQRTLGITFLFVTHDQEEALTLSDRIAVMSDGHVKEIASPAQLYENPSSRFVADFIGSMNFFPGEVTKSENGKLSISTDSMGEIDMPASNTEYAARSPVWVAIRPEKLKPVFSAPGDLSNVMQGVMGPSAYLGDRSHFYVHLSKREEPVLVALQNLERSIDMLRGPNQKVWLKWSADALVVLPRD